MADNPDRPDTLPTMVSNLDRVKTELQTASKARPPAKPESGGGWGAMATTGAGLPDTRAVPVRLDPSPAQDPQRIEKMLSWEALSFDVDGTLADISERLAVAEVEAGNKTSARFWDIALNGELYKLDGCVPEALSFVRRWEAAEMRKRGELFDMGEQAGNADGGRLGEGARNRSSNNKLDTLKHKRRRIGESVGAARGNASGVRLAVLGNQRILGSVRETETGQMIDVVNDSDDSEEDNIAGEAVIEIGGLKFDLDGNLVGGTEGAEASGATEQEIAAAKAVVEARAAKKKDRRRLRMAAALMEAQGMNKDSVLTEDEKLVLDAQVQVQRKQKFCMQFPAVIYLSGRRSGTEGQTQEWLVKHGFPPGAIVHRPIGKKSMQWKADNLVSFKDTIKLRGKRLDSVYVNSVQQKRIRCTLVGHVGDREDDVEAARRAGVRPIKVVENRWLVGIVGEGAGDGNGGREDAKSAAAKGTMLAADGVEREAFIVQEEKRLFPSLFEAPIALSEK